jgi:hypothetical protein
MDDLDYEKHLEDFKNLYGYYANKPYIDKSQTLRNAEEKAKYHHALSVFNPLRDWSQKSIQIAQNLSNDNARYYMLYGAGRRLIMMFYAYQAITHIAYDQRTEPLSSDEQHTFSREINIIYMHLRGVLDNFAWCLLYERQPELEGTIHRNDVGLFSQKFRRQFAAFSEIEDEITVHDVWNEEVKKRRDPVAHRIPLYVPPAVITQEEAKTYQALNNRFNDKLNSLKLDEADLAFDAMNTIGTFFPYFVHHPDEPRIPIYPTIPTDMTHLIRIGNAVEKGLLKTEKLSN